MKTVEIKHVNKTVTTIKVKYIASVCIVGRFVYIYTIDSREHVVLCDTDEETKKYYEKLCKLL